MLNWPQHRDHPLEADALAAKDQLKKAGVIKSTKGDLRLVAAAQAMRRGEYTDEFEAAAAMGKQIGQRREVEHWQLKLEELDQLAAAPKRVLKRRQLANQASKRSSCAQNSSQLASN